MRKILHGKLKKLKNFSQFSRIQTEIQLNKLIQIILSYPKQNLYLKTSFLARNIRNFNKRNLVKIKSETEKVNADNTTSTTSKANATSSNEVPSTDPSSAVASTTPPAKPNDSSTSAISTWGKNATTTPTAAGANNSNSISNYVGYDNQQVKLNMQSYKMVLLSEDFWFYKRNSLRKAKQVSFNKRFSRHFSHRN